MKLTSFENDNENVLHSYIFSQQAKPHAAIDALFSALLPFGKPFIVQPGEELSLYTEQSTRIVLLESGIFYLPQRQRVECAIGLCPSLAGLIDSYGVTYDVPTRPEHF